MTQVVELDHPLVAHHLTRLRDETTRPDEFRKLVHPLAMLVAYEATSDLALDDVQVKTPVQMTAGKQVSGRVGIVPILRTGLGMERKAASASNSKQQTRSFQWDERVFAIRS